MIYTSYFKNIKKVLGLKPNIRFCSIAGKTPQWFMDYDKLLDLKSFKYSDLAPKYSWWNVWHEMFKDNLESDSSKNWYVEHYDDTVLKTLDVKNVQRKLYELSDHNDICLLCYETPDKFCHRHLVAKWLNENGIECREFE